MTVGDRLLSIFCCMCGSPIQGNIQGRAECSKCVQGRVKYVERIERESGIKINNKADYAAAEEYCKSHPAPQVKQEKLTNAAPKELINEHEVNIMSREDLYVTWEDLGR